MLVPLLASTVLVSPLQLSGAMPISDESGVDWPNQLDGIDPGDLFGDGVAAIGDLDGDGHDDVAIGASGDDDGGSNRGAVWIVFLDGDGMALGHQKISATEGGFGGTLVDSDFFGASLASLDDLNGDGTRELAVGAYGDDTGGPSFGAVWVLFMNPDGTVQDQVKIAKGLAGFDDPLGDYDAFGHGIGTLGDIDGDGRRELVVGARWHDLGGEDTGGVWILHLADDGTVAASSRINALEGGPKLWLPAGAEFGASVDGAGDVDGDGVDDLAVGATGDDDSWADAGSIWLLFLRTDGSVKAMQKISATHGNFPYGAVPYLRIGEAVAGLGDYDGDGTPDIGIGTAKDRMYVTLLNPDGTVRDATTINKKSIASAIALGPDLDQDGRGELVAGARYDAAPNESEGSTWLIHMDPAATLVTAFDELSGTPVGLGGLSNYSDFGYALGRAGDVDGDGIADLAVGSLAVAGGGVHLLFLNELGRVRDLVLISAGQGGFVGNIELGDKFGAGVTSLGDLNGDGMLDIAVGAPGDDNAVTNGGAVWVLFLNANGMVIGSQRIARGVGGLTAPIDHFEAFGSDVSLLGDLDGDGVPEIVVGAPFNDTGGTDRGAAYVLFLSPDGTVKNYVKWSEGDGGFGATLGDGDLFGTAVTGLGDLNGDGVPDAAVGAIENDGMGVDAGEVWILFLEPDGTIGSERRMALGTGDFPIDEGDFFGSGLGGHDDHDRDGVPDLVIGAWGTSDPPYSCVACHHGAVWIAHLREDGSVKDTIKINQHTEPLAELDIDLFDEFGSDVAFLGDVDGDGRTDVAAGQRQANTAWVLFSEANWAAEPYGCALNPPDSLFVLEGAPVIGSTMTFGLLSPPGMPTPLWTAVVVATAPDPSFPCGTPIEEWGITGPFGELLVDTGSIVFVEAGLPTHLGVPGEVDLPIPAQPALTGLELYAQGVLIDLWGFVEFGEALTSALHLVLGS